MIAELGQHGEGPLATTLANTGRTVSAAVVGSAMDELGHAFPGCKGPDALACVDRRIRQMSRAAGAGFTGGVRDVIGWPMLAMAALVGLAVGLLAHWLWSVRTHSRPLRTRTT